MSSLDLKQITHVKIHPAIGIARVGNSKKDFFIAPELPYPIPQNPDFYRDESGALKRQAARFRVYGYDKHGKVVAELNVTNDVNIVWSVHVANKKAAWYEFEEAMDLPNSQQKLGHRNAEVTGDNRKKLIIDPGEQTISGKNQAGQEFHLIDKETLWGDVYLGELQTDKAGRLLFLGGRGKAASYNDLPVTSFGNNDGWYDDTSDGYVHATVSINGVDFVAAGAGGAWIVTTPPNYAPDIFSVSTMYDLMFDLFIREKWLKRPENVSFQNHILPILQEFSMNAGVNQGFDQFYGYAAPYDFTNQDYLKRLSNPNDETQVERQTIFNQFRNPDFKSPANYLEWPWMYGDEVDLTNPPPRGLFAITQTEYDMLDSWASGQFISDYDPDFSPPTNLDEITLSERPTTLDKATLIYCLGGPFHPGCEMTWPMRHAAMYIDNEPFRIKYNKDAKNNYGYKLTTADILDQDGKAIKGGPLDGSSPGDITRWMAIPWLTDTASCRSGYEMNYAPYLPTFWPATVPNSVLNEEDFKTAINPEQNINTRLAAYNQRTNWLRGLGGEFHYNQNIDQQSYNIQINNMIHRWHELGIIIRVPVPKKSKIAELPPYMYVEFVPKNKHDKVADKGAMAQAVQNFKDPELQRLFERLQEVARKTNEEAEQSVGKPYLIPKVRGRKRK